jgi:hypothetical protein
MSQLGYNWANTGNYYDTPSYTSTSKTPEQIDADNVALFNSGDNKALIAVLKAKLEKGFANEHGLMPDGRSYGYRDIEVDTSSGCMNVLKLFYNARVKNPPTPGSEIEKNQNKVFRYLLDRKSRCPTTANSTDVNKWIIPDYKFADFSTSIGLNDTVKAWHNANRNEKKNPVSSGIFGYSHQYPRGESMSKSIIFDEPDNETGGGKRRKTRRSKRTKRSKRSKKRRSTRRR